MNDQDVIAEQRHKTNPLFNDRKLKLGTFCTNLSGGCTISAAEGVLELSWPNTLALAKLADEMNFEALVPVGRWKGFGGETDFNGNGFECYSWAAGIGALTENCSVFATSHVPTVHPVMAAKQAMTIDHISGGRFTLNVVCGWYGPEIEMFGAPLLDHDRRYDMAEEWITIIKRLWTEEEEFDHDGEFFQIRNAIARPRPIQQPHPVVMSAGSSGRGRAFATQFADVGFTGHNGLDLDGLRGLVTEYHQLAWDNHQRKIQLWTNAYCYLGDTEKEAQDLYHHVVMEKGDRVAATNLTSTIGLDRRGIPEDRLEQVKENFIAGWGGYPLVGTKEQIVDGLQTLSSAGFDGVLLSFPRYLADMQHFKETTYPLIVEAGLR